MKPLLFSILSRPPHPTRDGLAIRNFHLLRALGEEFRIRAFVLRAPHLPDGQYPARVEVEEIAQTPRRVRRALSAAGSLATGRAYPPILYRSPRLVKALERAARLERPLWVVAHSYHVAPPALSAGSAAWIDFHNLDSQIWDRFGETASSRLGRGFARLQAARVRAFEKEVASRAAGLSCVSEADAQALEALSPGARPIIVPNGVDLSRYALPQASVPGKRIVFVGDLSWPPNADAVRWLAREIWPKVKRAHPDAVAEVLGREPPEDLTRWSDSSFRLLGEGQDTRPLWAAATVAVVPLKAGGGTRLKILEAAACGVPVVSTSVGAEGLALAPEDEIVLADDAEAFATAVVALINDPLRRSRIARAARERVEALYDWTAIGRRFARELASRRTA